MPVKIHSPEPVIEASADRARWRDGFGVVLGIGAVCLAAVGALGAPNAPAPAVPPAATRPAAAPGDGAATVVASAKELREAVAAARPGHAHPHRTRRVPGQDQVRSEQ
jgi:hypothetical protein